MSFFKTTMILAAASVPSLIPSFTSPLHKLLNSLFSKPTGSSAWNTLPSSILLAYSDASFKSELAKPQGVICTAQVSPFHTPKRLQFRWFVPSQQVVLEDAQVTPSVLDRLKYLPSWPPHSSLPEDFGPVNRPPTGIRDELPRTCFCSPRSPSGARPRLSRCIGGRAGRGAQRGVGPQWAGAVECACAVAWLGRASVHLGRASVHLGKEAESPWQWREPSSGEGKSRGPLRASRFPKSLLSRLRGPCSSAIPRRRAPSSVLNWYL